MEEIIEIRSCIEMKATDWLVSKTRYCLSYTSINAG